MEQYALVFFPENISEEIQIFRKKYDQQWHLILPHITIVFPFSGISEEATISHVNRVINHIPAFDIHLQGFMKSFDHCLFLLVQEGKEYISTLRDQLYTGILAPYRRDDIPFIPHMTIGYFATADDIFQKERYDTALKEAQESNFEVSSTVNTISLIKGDSISPASLVKTFTLP